MARITYRTPTLMKIKYHRKTLSDSAVYATYVRLLDVGPLFAEVVWLQIPVFDLAELGLGLLYSIVPVEFEPYSVDFEYEVPTPEEALQGIWAEFRPVEFEKLYAWMTDFREYIVENVEPEFQASLLAARGQKAVYGVTPYAMGIYDPVVAREFLRSTFQRLRLLRTPDVSYAELLDHIADLLEMVGVTDEITYNRLMLLFAAQAQALVLGLGVLGYSRLPEVEEGMAKVLFRDAKGDVHEVRFRTLDHLQMGLILGVAPLGYGLLLPRNSIYSLPEGRRNPPFVDVLVRKARGIINRCVLTAFAYSNYNRVEEMHDVHRSDRANQYALIQHLRRHVEELVRASVPGPEANPLRLRQYQNAALQLISWKAKRHRWGFAGWEAMDEESFKRWWLDNWERQGLSRDVLEAIHRGVQPWLAEARAYKVSVGERLRRVRRRLALAP